MPLAESNYPLSITAGETRSNTSFLISDPLTRKPPRRVTGRRDIAVEPLLTAEDAAERLNLSTDWVWDHSSRKGPLLPVIRMGDGTLRYRPSGIDAFIDERERISSLGRRAS